MTAFISVVNTMNCILFCLILNTQFLVSISQSHVDQTSKSWLSMRAHNLTDVKSFWSNNDTWKSSKLPEYNSDVTIDYNTSVFLDIIPPKLNNLIIYGKLSLVTTSKHPLNITLIVSYIQVIGELIIINDDMESQSYVNLILNPSSTEFSLLPSNAIDVYGKFTASGPTVVQSYYPLSQTSYSGDSIIYLDRLGDNSKIMWIVGDAVVLSPTAYYTSSGVEWFHTEKGIGSSVEIRLITAIDGNKIYLNLPLARTHICEITLNETFCGYVGLLTRKISIRSDYGTSSDSLSAIYGRGGVINIKRSDVDHLGEIFIANVAFLNMGDALTLSGGINLMDGGNETSVSTGSSDIVIINSVFVDSFYSCIYCQRNLGNQLRVSGNIFVNIWSNAIHIESKCLNFLVSNNLVIGHLAPPKKFLNIVTNTENHPFAAFVVYSIQGDFWGNKVAGSVDIAFAIAQMYFYNQAKVSGFPVSSCKVTHTQPLERSFVQSLRAASDQQGVRSQFTNEAFASVTGLMVVTLSIAEIESQTLLFGNNHVVRCGIINNFKLWRNSHAGIMAVDLTAEIVVHDSTLAENTIGVSLNVYAPGGFDFFIGIVNSKVIGIVDSVKSLMINCSSQSDTKWPLTHTNNILNGTIYNRVGVMVPWFLNSPQTCALSQTADCSSPFSVHKSCMLPYEKRYGLPVSYQSSELHLFGNIFSGFCHRHDRNGETYHSVAISLNPSQIDRFSDPVLEKNVFLVGNVHPSAFKNFTESSSAAAVTHAMTAFDIFGFRNVLSSLTDSVCGYIDKICLKRSPQSILYDIDGSSLVPFLEHAQLLSLDVSKGGQVIFNDDVSFNTPSRRCILVKSPERTIDPFAYCPKSEKVFNALDIKRGPQAPNTTYVEFEPLELFQALWEDRSPTIYPFFQVFSFPYNTNLSQTDDDDDKKRSGGCDDIKDFDHDGLLEKITASNGKALDTRYTYGYNFVSFSPVFEDCSGRILFNKNRLVLANGYINYIQLLKQTPPDWVLRWTAPSSNHSSLLHILFQENDRNHYNVFVGSAPAILSLQDANHDIRHVPSVEDSFEEEFIDSLDILNKTDAWPTLHEMAGTNTRDYDSNRLVVTLRGGDASVFYTFKRVPMLTVYIETALPLSMHTLIKGKLCLGGLLGLNVSRQVGINSASNMDFSKQSQLPSVKSYVEYSIVPSPALYVAFTDDEVEEQILELNYTFLNLSRLFQSGEFEALWGVQIIEATATLPVVQRFINESDIEQQRLVNPLIDINKLRLDLAFHNEDSQSYLKSASQSVSPPTIGASPADTTDSSLLPNLHIGHILGIVVVSFMVIASVLVAFCIYHRLLQRRSLMVAYRKTNVDLFELMAHFGVSTPEDLSPALKKELSRILDILFTEKLSLSSIVIFNEPSVVLKMEHALRILIVKSVILENKDANSLVMDLQVKSKKRYDQLITANMAQGQRSSGRCYGSCPEAATKIDLPDIIYYPAESEAVKREENPFQSQEKLPAVFDIAVSAQCAEVLKMSIHVIFDYYKYKLRTLKQRSASEDVEEGSQCIKNTLSQLKCSHTAIATMFQQNKAIELEHVSELTKFERKIYERLIKGYVNSKYAYIFSPHDIVRHPPFQEEPAKPADDSLANPQRRSTVDSKELNIVDVEFAFANKTEENLVSCNSSFVAEGHTTHTESEFWRLNQSDDLKTELTSNRLHKSGIITMSQPLPIMFTVPTSMRPPPLTMISVREIELNSDAPYGSTLQNNAFVNSASNQLPSALKPSALNLGNNGFSNPTVTIAENPVVSVAFRYAAFPFYDGNEVIAEYQMVESEGRKGRHHFSDVSSEALSRRSGVQSSEAEEDFGICSTPG